MEKQLLIHILRGFQAKLQDSTEVAMAALPDELKEKKKDLLGKEYEVAESLNGFSDLFEDIENLISGIDY